ncbi:hypothetical protein LCGC14_0209070 [marine sediment metagenome]|uniref:Uncharacterized protein n=1 Tax=marine sediment metagenome TaxID=412755 RepID=A0A0F9X0Y8_9ZZZZ
MPRITDIINKANPLITWKIYYHDPNSKDYYSTFSNLDGTAEQAPVNGVIVIQQPIENGRGIDQVTNGDYYALDEENKWIGMDVLGLQDRIDNNIPFTALKEGRWINLERFWDILYLAGDDKDFVSEPEGRISRIPK